MNESQPRSRNFAKRSYDSYQSNCTNTHSSYNSEMFAGFGGFPFSSHFDDFGDFGEFPRRRPRRAQTFKYYEALGVSRDATQAQIRKAFQQLAMRLHPDKGGDSEKFKELNEAYEVLKDENKRRRYDQVGDEGAEDGFEMPQEGTVDDLLSELMGMRGGRRARAHAQRRQRKSKDMIHTICVPLENLYNGATRQVTFNRERSCVGCKGTGFKGAARRVCMECHGRGVQVMMMHCGPGVIQEVQTRCEICSGTGLDANPVHYCELCCGAGEIRETKTLDVYIEQGMHENHKITYSGEASCSDPLLEPGDVIVSVQSETHPRFTRKNADLLYTAHITLCQSLCGVDIDLQHLDGRSLRIQSSPGEIIRPGQVKCIDGEGMPIHGQPSTKGNLYVRFEVKYPDRISPQQQERIRAVLDRGGASRDQSVGVFVPLRDVHDLEDELSARERVGKENGAAYETDDSDEQNETRNRVQCSQQ